MYEVELKLPSDPKLLKIIRCSVAHLCEISGFSNDDKNSVILAVDEAASNIIKHAYGNRKDQPMLIRCRLLDDRVEIVLRDFGEKPDPDKIKPRDLEEVKPGGLGVHFIQSCMDVVRYEEDAEKGNRLTLIKYLSGRKERK